MLPEATKRIFAAGFVVCALSCEGPPLPGDTEAPRVTVIVSTGRGDNIFRSTDDPWDGPESCIKVPDVPVQLIMIAGDRGGVQMATISVFPATIDPASVDVTPRPPEASHVIEDDRGRARLTITSTPPAPGMVRTGSTAVFEFDGSPPFAVSGAARDYAGNVGNLPQFEIMTVNDPTVCRDGQF